MKIGFTGTQFGMNQAQRHQLVEFFKLNAAAISEFHHGDCVGADAQAHNIARSFGLKVITHPCTIHSKRAHCSADYEEIPMAPLTRNKRIVKVVDHLVAAPFEPTEQRRSGTWATVRYARALERPVTMLERYKQLGL